MMVRVDVPHHPDPERREQYVADLIDAMPILNEAIRRKLTACVTPVDGRKRPWNKRPTG